MNRQIGERVLRVQKADEDGVKIARRQITVGLADPSRGERVRTLVRRWFRERAETVFREVFDAWAVKAEREGIKADGFQIRQMKNRWGSCTGEGHILLNPQLIIAPLPSIEYVVVHELCHLKEHNHSSRFYRLLHTLMPDWEQRRERLNQCVVE